MQDSAKTADIKITWMLFRNCWGRRLKKEEKLRSALDRLQAWQGGAVPQVAGTFHVVHFQDGCDFCM